MPDVREGGHATKKNNNFLNTKMEVIADALK